MRNSRALLAREAGLSRDLARGSTRPEIGRPGANMGQSYGEPLWKVRDCGKYLGISTNKVRELAERGRLPHIWLDEEAGLSGERRGLRFVPALIREWAIAEARKNWTVGNVNALRKGGQL